MHSCSRSSWALEALAEPRPKHPKARALLDGWHEQLKAERAVLVDAADDEEKEETREALEALERELFFRKDESHRSSIRRLVGETLRAAGEENHESYCRQAVKMYDTRGTLVHEGTVPGRALHEALTAAREIVPMVLKAKLGQ